MKLKKKWLLIKRDQQFVCERILLCQPHHCPQTPFHLVQLLYGNPKVLHQSIIGRHATLPLAFFWAACEPIKEKPRWSWKCGITCCLVGKRWCNVFIPESRSKKQSIINRLHLIKMHRGPSSNVGHCLNTWNCFFRIEHAFRWTACSLFLYPVENGVQIDGLV